MFLDNLTVNIALQTLHISHMSKKWHCCNHCFKAPPRCTFLLMHVFTIIYLRNNEHYIYIWKESIIISQSIINTLLIIYCFENIITKTTYKRKDLFGITIYNSDSQPVDHKLFVGGMTLSQESPKTIRKHRFS